MVSEIATIGNPANFKNGRHFAAFLGLVPKEQSSGGKYCYYMAKENLFTIADKLFSAGVVNMQYVGGETFMHKDFPDIVRYVKKLGLGQTLITNGIIPGLKIDKYHETVSTFNKIQISVNATGTRYDEVVGLKIYEKLLIALKNMGRYNTNIWLSFVVTHENLSDIDKIIQLAEQTLCAGVRIGILAKQGRGCENELSYFSCLPKASELLAEAKIKYPTIRIECHFNPTLSTQFSENNYFSEGMSMLFINLKGDIFPFPLLEVPEMKLGNVFIEDLLTIWQKSDILSQFRKSNTIDPTCQSCSTPCALRSPTMSYLWMGEIGKKVPCYRDNFKVDI